MMRPPSPEEFESVVPIGFDLLKQAVGLAHRDAGEAEEEALVHRAQRDLNGHPAQLTIMLGWIHMGWHPFIRDQGAETTLRMLDENGHQVDPDSADAPAALVCYARLQAAVLSQDQDMILALWNVAVREGYAPELFGLALIGSGEQIASREQCSSEN